MRKIIVVLGILGLFAICVNFIFISDIGSVGDFLEKITGNVVFENVSENNFSADNISGFMVNESFDNRNLSAENNFTDDNSSILNKSDSENESLSKPVDLSEEDVEIENVSEKIEVDEINQTIKILEDDGGVKNEYIISIKNPEDTKFFGLIEKSSDDIRIEKLKIIDDVKDSLEKSLITKADGDGIVELSSVEIRELKNRKDIAYIEPVMTFDIALSEVVDVINSTNVNHLKVDNVNLTGLYQTVCIIDTGVNYSHQDLLGRNRTTCIMDCVSDNSGCVENCSNSDYNGHGTHVAGIISASGGVVGVASEVGIIGMKVFPGSSRSGATTTIIDNAIDWCVDNSEIYNISVISMSLGSSSLYSSHCDSYFSTFNISINAAFNKNISVVVATGNDGSLSEIASPACLSKSIPVGDTYDDNLGSISWSSCTDSETAQDQIVCHANRNSLVKLFAPGANLNSTWHDGQWYVSGGTSMAAPVVAGAIAIINQYLNLTSQSKNPFEIESVLDETGFNISDSDSGLNFSRINVYDAVLSLDNVAPNVTLIEPNNLSVVNVGVVNFSCDISDNFNIKNLTLNLWDVNGLNFSNSSNSDIKNNLSLSEGLYFWNCVGYDLPGNLNNSGNRSLFVGNTSTHLVSPGDENITSNPITTFNCLSKCKFDLSLKNVTFSLWDSSNPVYSFTKNISGTENSTDFDYTFSGEQAYTWNCLSVNNESDESSGINFTITYNSTYGVSGDNEEDDGEESTADTSSDNSGGGDENEIVAEETKKDETLDVLNVSNASREEIINKSDEESVVDAGENYLNYILYGVACIVVLVLFYLFNVSKKKNGKKKKS